MVEGAKCRISATFADFNPLSLSETMLFFSSRVSSLPFLPMLDVYIDDVKIAKVMTTSGVQRIYIAYGGSLVIKITKTVIVKEDFIDDKHLLIFIGAHLGKKIDILLARECSLDLDI